MMAHPTHQGDIRRIGRCLYVWREPDASIRHTARFCSLGPPPAAGPVATPLDRVTPGESSERFPHVDLVARRRRAPPPGEPMNLESELNQTIDNFQAKIADLARRAVIDTVGEAFGRVGTPQAGALAMPVGRPPGRGKPKRRDSELRELSERFTAFVRHHPGLRIEQINKQLGTTTKDLALPIRKLISEGALSAKGQKRSTTYFAGKKKGKN
jgi:hypothetical protein